METVEINEDIVLRYLVSNGFEESACIFQKELKHKNQNLKSIDDDLDFETQIVTFNPCENDPYGSTNMPIYQTATFQQPGATTFGDYDYTRSGNPTRDALQNITAKLENSQGAKSFAFSTGMAALNAVIRLAQNGDEVIVNDDSYGGTYRLMSKIATRHGIRVTYANLSGESGPSTLKDIISPLTRLVMIESPTNPMQKICNISALASICHLNSHPINTLLSIDNTMMSPVLSQPLIHGADIVIHSATKFMAGHSDTMAGIVVVKDKMDGNKSLAENMYFYQNAEGSGLAPFDCWLVLRGLRTISLRVHHQQNSACIISKWLRTLSAVKSVIYCGLDDHPDSNIHKLQASGGGCVVCFTTGNFELSKHIVTVTKLFKITVSFGAVTSVISVPAQMSHASIPQEIRSVREFPEDLIRMSIGLESPRDLIADLWNAFISFKE